MSCLCLATTVADGALLLMRRKTPNKNTIENSCAFLRLKILEIYSVAVLIHCQMHSNQEIHVMFEHGFEL